MGEQLKRKMIDMLDESGVGTLATIRSNKPFSRFMLFFHENLTIYTATNKNTHKVEDIEANPNVHILLGLDVKNVNGEYLEIEAKASIDSSPEIRRKFWDEKLKDWLSGPDDPNYILLKLEPEHIRYFSSAGEGPEELTL
ncbi:pyridoxamine 5'-phosphate oxidase family protein [Bacillus sp. ISL-47]|uniref:pyridoxamine 5'-phosphate oxidase family protein n=1 Tax=Bacillus sp. ISL-47 TaxID=2819130 RepID=UPI001BE595C5|nr:pyridoxamine 5'-phosphate oxidase family protein [Bacillus sp. ISL-47]MBT2688480.1 pyridoxamine 5'-phosphate oxidase family protein [Bacillus sp. ISL-47]MBT2709057.1 pyridoxamine 5'-phosphate oxidase family protein [Pseudomonas sp. ISL-84]